MTNSANFPRFDGLMDLAKREGVDIRPTLLRVLTDLYVQSPLHTEAEERQYVELAGRLIGDVDDATRAAVRARLATYPRAPAALVRQLDAFRPPAAPVTPATPPPVPPQPAPPLHEPPAATRLPGEPENFHALNEMFFTATSAQRIEIIRRLDDIRLSSVPRLDPFRAPSVLPSLERAALAGDRAKFAFELAEVLILPRVQVNRIVDDPGGEPLAFAAKILDMSSATFQRVAMFLSEEREAPVQHVFRLARLYDALTGRHATIMFAIWRAAMVPAARAQHRAYLHDDETSRTRHAPGATTRAERPAAFPARPSRNAG